MDVQYLLSVIIPVYNAEMWLDECIHSILRNVNLENVEVILIDDGSTDLSGEICDRYAAEHSFVRSFHKKNGGVASARNLGLKYAAGKYIAWVDPDDKVSDDWLSRICDAVDQGEPDVIVMDSIRFGNGEIVPEIYGRSGGFVNRDLFFEDVMRDIRMLSGLPNKVMKSSLYSDVTFDVKLAVLEDYAAMPEILKKMQTVYYVPHCLYYYRQHAGSLLHQASSERAYQSVQTAYAREKAMQPQFHGAAVTATSIQAFYYCRSAYMLKDFKTEKAQLAFCVGYIRQHLYQLCTDAELPKHLKIKMILVALNCYGLLIKLRGGKK